VSGPLPARQDAGQVITPASALGTNYYAEGTTLHYETVATIAGTDVDAVVTFVSGSNLGEYDPSSPAQYEARLGKIRRIDHANSGPFLEHSVKVLDVEGGGSATLKIDFLRGGTYAGPGTGTPIVLTNLTFNVYDLDGLQAIAIDGLASYVLSTNTHLTMTSPRPGTFRFTAPSASTSEATGTSYTVGRVEVTLNPTSVVTYQMFFPRRTSGSQNLDFSRGVPWEDDFGGTNADATPAPYPLGPPRITNVDPGNGSLNVTYAPPAGSETITACSYRVGPEADQKPRTWIPLSDSERAAQAFTIARLTNGTTYVIELRCSNAIGDGRAATASGTPVGLPGGPTITLLQSGDGALIITFTPPSNDGGAVITNYQAQLDGGAWTPFTPAVTTSPATLPGLANGVPVSVRLRAVNAIGAGPASNEATATPRAGVAGVRVLPGNGSATLLFDRHPEATAIEIQLSTASSPHRVLAPWYALGDEALRQNATQLTNLTNGTAIYVQVRAVAAWDDRSPASEPICFTPTATPALPVAEPELLLPQAVQQVKRDAAGAVLLHFDYVVKNTSGVTLENIWVRALDLPPGATVVSLVEDAGPGTLLIFPWHADHWYWDGVKMAAGASRTLTVTIRVEGNRR
jgi:hypothetical protein